MTDDDLTARLADNLASNLKWVRDRRRLTQAGLARLADIPRSTLANLETGMGNPTLSVLGRLAASLQLSIEELLSTPRATCQLYPAGSLPVQRRGGRRKSEVHKLLPDPIPGMEIDRMDLPAGGAIKGVPHRPGTREYLYCESGELVVRAAGERYDVSAGDVLAFQGDQPHSYANEGSARAVAFSVVTLAPAGTR